MCFRLSTRCPIVVHAVTVKTNLIFIFIYSVSWRKLSQEPACTVKLVAHMLSSPLISLQHKNRFYSYPGKSPPMKPTFSNKSWAQFCFQSLLRKLGWVLLFSYFLTMKWWLYQCSSKKIKTSKMYVQIVHESLVKNPSPTYCARLRWVLMGTLSGEEEEWTGGGLGERQGLEWEEARGEKRRYGRQNFGWNVK